MKIRADDRIAADADARRLADLALRELSDRFVRQRSAARHDADVSFQMNVARHDADLAFARRNDARTVRPDQPRFPSLEEVARANHVESRNAFGDADDQFDAGVRRFHDRVGGERRRNEDHGRVGSGLAARFFNGVEDVDAFVLDAAFSRGDSANNVGAVLDGLKRMKRTFAAGDALNDQSRIFINEYAHL